MTDISALETLHAELSQYLHENGLTQSGTPEYLKAQLKHRLLNQIIKGQADPAEVYLRLQQIEDGTHPLLVPATKGTG